MSRQQKTEGVQAPPAKSQEQPAEPVYVPNTTSMDRTFFLVDLARLRKEGDTLENALVMYRPLADIKRVSRPAWCSVRV